MRRSIASFLTIFLAFAAQGFAQTNTANAIQTAGCINQAQHNGSIEGSTGVPPTPPNAAPAAANSGTLTGAFVLNGATPPASERDSRATKGDTLTSYVLEGARSLIEPHVGHQVEVTGTLVELPATNSGSSEPRRQLRVSAIKMVATTCAKPPNVKSH